MTTGKAQYFRKGIVLFSALIGPALISVLLDPELQACSVFCIDKGSHLLVGRNQDWDFGEGLIMINKRNQSKYAFTYYGESRENLASWTSRYGSITLNQYGRDDALSGMNEAGLVVSALWLDESQYPAVDQRPSVSIDQYLQYLLDNFQSIEEILASKDTVRVRPNSSNYQDTPFCH